MRNRLVLWEWAFGVLAVASMVTHDNAISAVPAFVQLHVPDEAFRWRRGRVSEKLLHVFFSSAGGEGVRLRMRYAMPVASSLIASSTCALILV